MKTGSLRTGRPGRRSDNLPFHPAFTATRASAPAPEFGPDDHIRGPHRRVFQFREVLDAALPWGERDAAGEGVVLLIFLFLGILHRPDLQVALGISQPLGQLRILHQVARDGVLVRHVGVGIVRRFLHAGFFRHVDQGRRILHFHVGLFELLQALVRSEGEFDHVLVLEQAGGQEYHQREAMEQSRGYEGDQQVLGRIAAKGYGPSQEPGLVGVFFRVNIHA